jgi:hypothetical protein
VKSASTTRGRLQRPVSDCGGESATGASPGLLSKVGPPIAHRPRAAAEDGRQVSAPPKRVRTNPTSIDRGHLWRPGRSPNC